MAPDSIQIKLRPKKLKEVRPQMYMMAPPVPATEGGILLAAAKHA